MNKNKNLGFTLAEVLIVIGIIGVVAALTLPNLNHATGDKEKVTKVKKIYSSLTEAFDRAQVIYGDFDTWFKDLDCENSYTASCSERFAKRLTEFMKISKDCGFNEGCFSTAPLILADGTEHGDFDKYVDNLKNQHAYMVTLPDGISLGFTGGDMYSKIRVDIDGPNKGKTQMGSDIFDFSIYNNEDYGPTNRLNPSHYFDFNDSFGESTSGNYATAWVIENGNLDYLKCPDELDWETKTSCE